MALADGSIETEMAADWAKIQEKYAVEPDETPPAPAQAVEETPAVEAPADTGRPRDESGRFAKAPSEAVAKEPKESKEPAAEPPSATPSQGPDSAQAPERDINRAPSTWKPTARAEWEKLPPTVRAEIHRRETDFMNGQSQLLPDARFGKAVAEVVAPYRMLIEAEGGTPERAIADLMRTAALFRVGTPQQKAQALAGIAKQFNIDIGQPAAQPGQPTQQAYQDPRVDGLLAHLQSEAQQRQAAEQRQLETTVVRWMEEKDAAGNPTRPYLGDVMNEMGALVPQIRQANPSFSHEQVLQQAYDRAIWGNPEIRTLLQQQEAQRSEQTRVADNQTRVREARRAASVNVPRRASTPSPGKPGKLEETIEATARELGFIT